MAEFGPDISPGEGSGSPGNALDAYLAWRRRRVAWVAGLALLTLLLALASLGVGTFRIGPGEMLAVATGELRGPAAVVLLKLRLPRMVAALVTGWSLGLAGLVCQTLLRNPLASPSTLGISQGAAFGAAAALVFLGAGILQAGALRSAAAGGGGVLLAKLPLVTAAAFLGSLAATLAILALGRLRRLAPEALILAGVALSSLFVSGTILIQYFASETELAAVVFWTFGDVARSSWREIGLLALAALLLTGYSLRHAWDFNAAAAGDEVAKGLGADPARLRLFGMLFMALTAALATAFHGVIAFLGLLAPHLARHLLGQDQRLLIPGAGLMGALLLLLADTLGRVLVGSGALPVGVLTSFLGAPVFLGLLMRMRMR